MVEPIPTVIQIMVVVVEPITTVIQIMVVVVEPITTVIRIMVVAVEPIITDTQGIMVVAVEPITTDTQGIITIAIPITVDQAEIPITITGDITMTIEFQIITFPHVTTTMVAPYHPVIIAHMATTVLVTSPLPLIMWLQLLRRPHRSQSPSLNQNQNLRRLLRKERRE
jgi:hypothetical protein